MNDFVVVVLYVMYLQFITYTNQYTLNSLAICDILLNDPRNI